MTRLNTIKSAIKNVNELVEKTIQYAIENNLQDNEVLLKAKKCVIDAKDLVSGKSEDIVTFKQMDTAEDLNITAWHLVHNFIETAKTETAKTEKPAGKKTAKTETVKTETAKTEKPAGKKTAKTETVKTETAKTETVKTETAKTETAKTEKPAGKKTAKTETVKTEKTVKAEKPAGKKTANTETAKTEKPADKKTVKTETAKTEKPADKSSAWDDVKDCKMNTNGNDSKSLVGKFIIEFGKKGEFTGEELAKAFLKFKTKTGITPDEKWARRNVLLFIQKGLILCEI